MSEDEEADPLCVLVVEDDSAAIRLYQEAFGELDERIAVSVATDGEQALEVLLEQGEHADAKPPNVVVLALDIPKIDGLTVLRELRENGRFPAVPVVVCSQHTDRVLVEECYRLGASAYLEKPEDYEGLLDVAEEVRSFWVVDELR